MLQMIASGIRADLVMVATMGKKAVPVKAFEPQLEPSLDECDIDRADVPIVRNGVLAAFDVMEPGAGSG